MNDRPKCAAKWPMFLATIALIVLHQDWWNWDKVDPRLFGFLPIGLAYHAGYAVACAVLMYGFVKFLWPRHLEDSAQESGQGHGADGRAGH